MGEKNYQAIIEAILFTMGEAVPLERIADAIELDKKKTKAILKEMIESYKSDKTGISIIELDGSYQMCTKPEMYEYLIKIAKQPQKRVLTDVLLETTSSRSRAQRLKKYVGFPVTTP
jgi:segregation and condensation protein B